MSGRKTTYTTIPEDELRRLRKSAAQANSLQADNKHLKKLNKDNEAALNEYRAQMKAVNGNIERLNQKLAEQVLTETREVQTLRNQLRQTVRDNQNRFLEETRRNEKRIADMQKSFTSELTMAVGQIHTDMEDAIDANNRRIENAMNQNTQHLKEEMASLEGRLETEMQEIRSQIDTVEQKVKATAWNQGILLEMAEEYSHTAQMLNQNTQENYRVDLLCPGRIQQVKDRFASAEKEIKDAKGMPENAATARREARKALEAALELQQEVIQAEQRWNMHYQSARQVLNAASAQLEASRNLELPEEPEASVDVDCWTCGDLTAIESRLMSYHARIKDTENLGFTDMDEIQDACIQASREIDDTAMFAVEAFYASQDRGEIAQDVADQLNEYGLSVVDYGYQGEDKRSAHRLFLKNNVTGFQIVITQTPEIREDGTIANKLESDILNYGNFNEERGDQIAREVLASLSGLGFRQEPVSTVSGYEHLKSDRLEYADMQKWKTEQVTEVMKPEHAKRKAAES